jgi:hypothetical protein
MATKNTGIPCYDKADGDEPLFVLRSTDKTAPGAIRYWVSLARRAGCPEEKLAEALKCADEMTAWQRQHGAKGPD